MIDSFKRQSERSYPITTHIFRFILFFRCFSMKDNSLRSYTSYNTRMNLQQFDKIINYFRINHNFHDPYQLILDGNFIKLLVEKDLDLKRKMENVSKGRVFLKVTSCIIRELELLGDTFRIVTQRAKSYQVIRCNHPLQYTVDKCIISQLAKNNQKCYFICSQDLELRRQLRNYENVPIIYFGPDQRVTMEDIFRKNLAQMKKQIQSKLLPGEKERKQVHQFKKQQTIEQKKQRIKKLSSQFGIDIKTKIAKGPNPLSMKKKKKQMAVPVKQIESNSEPKQKRKRIRKRNRSKGQQVSSLGQNNQN